MAPALNGHALAALSSAGLGSLVTRLGAIGLDEFHVGFRGRIASPGRCPRGSPLSRSRLDAALVEAAIQAGAIFLEETHAAGGRNSRRRAPGAADPSRAVRSTSRRASSWSPRDWAVRILADGSVRARTEIRPGSRIGAGCLIADPCRLYENGRSSWRSAATGYVGAVRVEDGSLNVAAAFAPALVRRWGSPGLAAAAVLAEAGSRRSPAWRMRAGRGRPASRGRRGPWPRSGCSCWATPPDMSSHSPGRESPGPWRRAQAVDALALQAIERWDPRLAEPGRPAPPTDRPPADRLPRGSLWACASPGWLRSDLKF